MHHGKLSVLARILKWRVCEQGRAMERLAEDRKGPSSMEHRKRQMVAALETNVKVLLPVAPC